MKPSTKTIRQQAAQAVIETHNENAVLRVEIARMRPVFDAGLALFRHKRHGLSLPANGLDCEGEYWIVRAKWKDVKAFKTACARAERKAKKGGK